MSSLSLISSVTVTSEVSEVQLTGINDDCVYVVTYSGVFFNSDGDLYQRVTKGGATQSDSNYEVAGYIAYADTGFGTISATGANNWDLNQGTGDDDVHSLSGINYLYNFYENNTYSQIVNHNSHRNTSQNRVATYWAVGSHKVASYSDGIAFGSVGENIAGGKFALWKLK